MDLMTSSWLTNLPIDYIFILIADKIYRVNIRNLAVPLSINICIEYHIIF